MIWRHTNSRCESRTKLRSRRASEVRRAEKSKACPEVLRVRLSAIHMGWGSLIGSIFSNTNLSGFGWSLAPRNSGEAYGDNGLYGGQLSPCAAFLATLVASHYLLPPSPASECDVA